MYLVDLANPAASVRLNGDLAQNGAVSQAGSEFTLDSTHVVYTAGELESKFELYAVDLSEPGASLRLNGPLAPGGIVTPSPGAFAFVPERVGFYINPGLTDARYDPAAAGPGFFVTVFPEPRQMFLTRFSCDTDRPTPGTPSELGEPGHRWLTAQGGCYRDEALLSIYLTQGGVFDNDEPTPETGSSPIGLIRIRWSGCENAWLDYSVARLGLKGSIPVRRIVTDNVPLCEELAANPDAAPAESSGRSSTAPPRQPMPGPCSGLPQCCTSARSEAGQKCFMTGFRDRGAQRHK